MSGRGPTNERDRAPGRRRSAERQRARRTAGPILTGSATGSAASASMNSEVFTTSISATRRPSDFSARCSATRTATSLIDRRAAVAAIDWPSSEIDWTMSRWRGGSVLHQLLRVAERVRILALGRGEKVLKSSIGSAPSRPAATHRVDDLVAGDRVHPGPELLAAVPGVPLEMDRQQRLLHRILDIGVAQPGALKRPTRHRPDRTTDILQQPPVDPLVARHGGPHHLRPGIVRQAFDGRPLIRTSFRFGWRYRPIGPLFGRERG